jgi:hypothetical protein
LAGTELEYLFFLCRGIFDLMQEITRNLWARISFNGAKPGNLPKSFGRMVLVDGVVMEPQQIVERHCVPPEFATYYHQQAEFFVWLRDYRDQILHSGKGFDPVFVTESGFGVLTSEKPFDAMSIWDESNTKPNAVGSFLAVVHHVVLKTLNAMEGFAEVFSKIVRFPPDLVTRFDVFVCGYHIHQLVDLKEGRRKSWA